MPNKATETDSSKAPVEKKKSAGGGFMKPLNIREPLQPIVGSDPLPRTEVVKRVWAYIREHKLQDKDNRRQINADDNLRKVFNKEHVTMFEMTKLINLQLAP